MRPFQLAPQLASVQLVYHPAQGSSVRLGGPVSTICKTKMSKINNLDFPALNLSRDNYLQWALDTKIILKSKGLDECITEDNNSNEKDRYGAILIIRHHLIESLNDHT